MTARSLHAKAMCDKHGPDVADVGPGGDWVCLMSWTDPQVPMPPEGYGKFELNVHSNDCYTAGGPSKLTGFLTITDTRGREVTNPLFEFDGCFDPGADNSATGVFFPSLFAVTTTTLTPDDEGRDQPEGHLRHRSTRLRRHGRRDRRQRQPRVDAVQAQGGIHRHAPTSQAAASRREGDQLRGTTNHRRRPFGTRNHPGPASLARGARPKVTGTVAEVCRCCCGGRGPCPAGRRGWCPGAPPARAMTATTPTVQGRGSQRDLGAFGHRSQPQLGQAGGFGGGPLFESLSGSPRHNASASSWACTWTGGWRGTRPPVAPSGAVELWPVGGVGERGEHVCELHGPRHPDNAVAGVGADRLHPGDVAEPGGDFSDAAAAAHAAYEQAELTHDGLTLETPSALTPSVCAAVLSARCPRGTPCRLSALWQERTAAGQSTARPPAEPEALNSGPEPPRPAPQKQAKEVFEMAASLLIEEESGTYTGRIRHRHNGYYAGDFSQRSRFGSQPRVSCAERGDAPRAENRSQPPVRPLREL